MRQLTIRPLHVSDLPAVNDMFGRLTTRTAYLRFFSPGEGALRRELAYLAALDGHERFALVATTGDQLVGIARFHRTEDGRAVAAVLVEDGWQHQGLGRRLTAELTAAARAEGVAALDVSILGENLTALRLLRRLVPGVHLQLDHGVFEASIPLAA